MDLRQITFYTPVLSLFNEGPLLAFCCHDKASEATNPKGERLILAGGLVGFSPLLLGSVVLSVQVVPQLM